MHTFLKICSRWLGLLLGTALGLSAAFEQKVLPVPMYIEEAEIFTDLHLSLNVDELDLGLMNRSPSGDMDLERMLGFFEALVAGQWAEAEAASLPVRELPPETNRQILEAYAELIGAAGGDIRIERLVQLGDDRLLVWSMPIDPQEMGYDRLIRSFRFLRNEQDGGLYFEGPRRDPLAILITSLYQEAQRFPDGEIPSTDRPFEYGYDYPMENHGEAPRFLFNGQIVQGDVFGTPSGAEPSALAFYREAMQALKSGDPARFATFFAPESRARFDEWVAEMEAGEFSAYRDDMVMIGKEVYFVLNADPAYFLLHLPTFEGIEGASFRYDVVWRNPEGTWQIVNFFVEGFFDDIIKNRGLFEEPFLRPTLIAAGVLDDERKALAITPPSSPPANSPPSSLASAPPLGDVFSPESAGTGLPRWIWALLLFLALLLGYVFWRQSASSPDANTPSS